MKFLNRTTPPTQIQTRRIQLSTERREPEYRGKQGPAPEGRGKICWSHSCAPHLLITGPRQGRPEELSMPSALLFHLSLNNSWKMCFHWNKEANIWGTESLTRKRGKENSSNYSKAREKGCVYHVLGLVAKESLVIVFHLQTSLEHQVKRKETWRMLGQEDIKTAEVITDTELNLDSLVACFGLCSLESFTLWWSQNVAARTDS